MKCSHVIVTRDGTHIGKGNILLSYDLRIWVLQILPPLQRISSRDLGRTREKMGKIYPKLFFSLPSSFIFSMVTPFHFAHLYHFTPRDASQSVKNPGRILYVSQITLNTELFHW
jgi:hypothetical protein